jgi:Tol biopolymer transport system component
MLFLAFAFCFFPTLPGAYGQNPFLRELVDEDQADQRGEDVKRSNRERNRIVLALLGQGAVTSPEDKFHAAMVLQHTGLTFCEGRLVSTSPDNYFLAHILFTSAFVDGYEKARYYVAASIDRYMSFTEGYQKYGTNRLFNEVTGKEELVPIDRATPDSERAKYGVPPLAELLKRFPEQAPKETQQPQAYSSGQSVTGPVIFAVGAISTGDYESHPAFTPDGRTLYFVKSTPTFSFWTIVVSRFVDGHWTTPEVAPFSGQFSDADPFITADGKQLYFISRRPGPGKTTPDLDIWVMDKTETGWSEPRNLGAPVNSPGNEWYPTLAADGTLYFGSDRPGGKGATDIYRSRLMNGKYQQPENFGEAVNTEFDEYEPYIAPDQSYLIFMAAGRPDGRGGGDLYISHFRDGAWTKAQNLGQEINSPRDEYSPKVSPDGKYFFFASARGRRPPDKPMNYAELLAWLRGPRNGLGDIYYLDSGSVIHVVVEFDQGVGAERTTEGGLVPIRLDSRVPHANRERYENVRDALKWENPFIIVRPEDIEVRLPRTQQVIKVEGLAAHLASLPISAWPYGRVVALQEIGIQNRGDRSAIKNSFRKVQTILENLDLETYLWPSN